MIRAAEQAIAGSSASGIDYALVARRAQGRGLLPLPGLPHRRPFSGFSRAARRTRTRAVGAAATALFLDGDADVVEIVYTKFVSRGHAGGRAASGSCRSSRDESE